MRIIDGDTVKHGGTRYRLAGIDAPESGQLALDGRGRRFDAGAAATNALSQFLDDMHARRWTVDIVCRPGDVDRYGRQLGRIELSHANGRTLDACAWMVSQGWAVAEYGNQYRHLERDARRHRRGLWAGTFERPKDWRRAQRVQSAPARPEDPSLLELVLVGTLRVVLAIMGMSLRRTRYRRRRRRYW